jgi:8-oxo-dGTP diphosphatase
MAQENILKVAKTFLFWQDKYLLIRRSATDKTRPLEWDTPGGRIEPGETQEAGLIREVKEETGVDISSCRIFLLKEWEFFGVEGKSLGKDFVCLLDSKKEIKLSWEHNEEMWLTKEESQKNQELPDWMKENIAKADKIIQDLKNAGRM